MSISNRGQCQPIAAMQFKSIVCLFLIAMGLILSGSTRVAAGHGELVPATPKLGKQLAPSLSNTIRQHVFADGEGLPMGKGSAVEGKELYLQKCAQCHGSAGQGGRAMELVGDRSLLNNEYPDKGIAVYWPYAPTLFEYIYRSMPPDKPASLSVDQLYSIIAHLLVLNDLWDETEMLDKAALQMVKMPNVNGFETVGH